MNKNFKVTAKAIDNFTPDDNAITHVCISGNVTELRAMDRSYNNLRHIKRINQNEYYDIRTGEVKEYQHKEQNRSRNMNRSFERLRQLINTNFTGEINERHITLTYAEIMTDFDKASMDFKRFWEKLHYHYPDLEFIRIIEPQQTGSWHIHALLKSKKYSNLSIPLEQLETLWGHGFVRKTTTLGCDNVGAYFTALLKNLDVFEDDTKDVTDKQYIVKNARLRFYPPNKRFYGYSKGIVQPTRFKTTYKEALKYVNEKNLAYSSASEIILTYENPEENVTVNRIARYQFNKKRIKDNPSEI
ncbi:MAG: hypothetical protein IJY29_05215 [Ruminococcus sp.]|nr:hypothetical protein [Ruminococcus sp.]